MGISVWNIYICFSFWKLLFVLVILFKQFPFNAVLDIPFSVSRVLIHLCIRGIAHWKKGTKVPIIVLTIPKWLYLAFSVRFSFFSLPHQEDSVFIEKNVRCVCLGTFSEWQQLNVVDVCIFISVMGNGENLKKIFKI